MKTNVTHLCGNAAAPVLKVSGVNDLRRDNRREMCRQTAPHQVRARPILTMIWRHNPKHGRLECRWATDRGTATDEGVSSNHGLRQAA
jgi:hypothetical protein